MAQERLTDRPIELEEVPADDDLIHVVDVSDDTDDASGTSKKWKILTWLKTVFALDPHDNDAHDDLEFELLQLTAQTPPATPSADDKYVYVKATGTSPNREVVMCVKNEEGEEIILSSIIT